MSIADDIVDGLFCQTCGELIDGEAPGYPRFCNGCEPRRERQGFRPHRNVKCPSCDKRFATTTARDQHERDKHGGQTP